MDSVGEAMSGGLAARAVEPDAGEGHEPAGGTCLNCRAALIGPYCHCCGQSGHVHRTISAWWHDFLHGVLHLDGKIWRTLPLLAVRPGALTRRYVDGERARFVSPLALFLFSVFLMFAMFSMIGAPVVGLGEERTEQELTAQIEELDRRLVRLRAARPGVTEPGRAAALDERIEEVKDERDALAATRKYLSGSIIETDFNTGWKRLDKGVQKANENPSLLLYKVQTNAYKFSWALIPLSVPFLWLLFLHRRRYRAEFKAYDHLVFVTYSIAFMSLFVIAFVALRALGLQGPLLNWALVLVPPVHMYRQLRGAYGLSRPSAAWRTAALLFFSAVAITLFSLILPGIGVLG
ncbi:MAG: DUF3667 domain-containing protein [Allosphingosinicella sp.]